MTRYFTSGEQEQQSHTCFHSSCFSRAVFLFDRPQLPPCICFLGVPVSSSSAAPTASFVATMGTTTDTTAQRQQQPALFVSCFSPNFVSYVCSSRPLPAYCCFLFYAAEVPRPASPSRHTVLWLVPQLPQYSPVPAA